MPGTCPKCHHSVVACTCDMSYAAKLRGFQVHGSVTETATRRRYFDEQALNEQLGSTAKDRKERYVEQTKGLGHARTDSQGRVWHKDRKAKEVRQLDPATVERTYLGGDLNPD